MSELDKLTVKINAYEPGATWVTSSVNYLNVCAHCGECLKQLVSAPNKLNVVLYYRDDTGTIVPWKPESKQ